MYGTNDNYTMKRARDNNLKGNLALKWKSYPYTERKTRKVQHMMVTLEDLPKKVIDIIYGYLTFADIYHVGNVYKRIARYELGK